MNLRPSEFMEMYSYGAYLVNVLQVSLFPGYEKFVQIVLDGKRIIKNILKCQITY